MVGCRRANGWRGRSPSSTSIWRRFYQRPRRPFLTSVFVYQFDEE